MFKDMPKKMPQKLIDDNYERAAEQYRYFGVDTDAAMRRLSKIPVSIHCWQGDDVGGFEGAGELSGGILATGNYPGKPRSADELRQDFIFAHSLIPGTHRFNLHASYRESGNAKVDRDEIELDHFKNWIEWARKHKLALDFNPTFFAHPRAETGLTLSSKDAGIRKFWIEHGKRCRKIAAGMGEALGSPCIDNFWVPDGMKDYPADRLGYRELLRDALDEIFETEYPRDHTLDSVESKLFGIGAEAFTVGSHEFYLSYALSRKVMLTIDSGHFHPTENISEKISAVLPFAERLLLHISRPMRWDSDHVVVFDDTVKSIGREIVRSDAFNRIFVALDFFDASINRITAWVVGARSALKSLLLALLEPTELILEEERKGNFGNRLALFEELKTLPFGSVWDKYVSDAGITAGAAWLDEIQKYETNVLKKRN